DDPRNEAQKRAVCAAPRLGKRRLGNDPDGRSLENAPSQAKKAAYLADQEPPEAKSEETQMGGGCRPKTGNDLCALPRTQQAHATPHKRPTQPCGTCTIFRHLEPFA